MPPAARITDMHVCPMVTGVVPHVGGPILPPCAPTVLIGYLPAARVADMATCVGPPDVILMGSPTVLIGYLMAARIGGRRHRPRLLHRHHRRSRYGRRRQPPSRNYECSEEVRYLFHLNEEKITRRRA